MYLSISQQMWIVLPMEKWCTQQCEVISKTVLLYNRNGNGAGCHQRGRLSGAGHPEMGHYYVLTPNGCGKRIQGCLSFPQWLFGRFAAGLVIELVRVFVGKHWTQQQCMGYSSLLHRTSSSECDSYLPPRRHCLWRRSHEAPTTYVRSCSLLKFTALLNGYLLYLMWKYIVTPAVCQKRGSATLGNFVLTKEVSEKLKNKQQLSLRG